MSIKEKYSTALNDYECQCAICRCIKTPAQIKAGDKYMVRSISLKKQTLIYKICAAHAVRIVGLT